MKMALGFFVIAAVVVITATFPIAQEPPCYSYVPPTCPTAFKCSDTFCDVPSEAEINSAGAYSLDDIGLVIGDNPAGVLILRSQDRLCKATARWDEAHSVIIDACVFDGGGSGSYLQQEGGDHTTECFTRKKCEQGCTANSGEYSGVRQMVKNGASRAYILPLYRCSAQNDVEDTRILSEKYYWCDNTSVCPPPPQSGSGGGGQ